VKSYRIKPERRNRPTNLTLDPEVKEASIKLAQELGYRSLSEMVAELLQVEISRNASLLSVDEAAAKSVSAFGESRKSRRLKGK
jgi:hypothetical protein